MEYLTVKEAVGKAMVYLNYISEAISEDKAIKPDVVKYLSESQAKLSILHEILPSNTLALNRDNYIIRSTA